MGTERVYRFLGNRIQRCSSSRTWFQQAVHTHLKQPWQRRM